MHMIRHYYKFVQFNMRKMNRDIIPTLFHHPPRVIQNHFPVGDFAKQTFAVLRAHRYKIRAGLGIIIFPQPDGTAMVNFRMIGHLKSHVYIPDHINFRACWGDGLGRRVGATGRSPLRDVCLVSPVGAKYFSPLRSFSQKTVSHFPIPPITPIIYYHRSRRPFIPRPRGQFVRHREYAIHRIIILVIGYLLSMTIVQQS